MAARMQHQFLPAKLFFSVLLGACVAHAQADPKTERLTPNGKTVEVQAQSLPKPTETKPWEAEGRPGVNKYTVNKWMQEELDKVKTESLDECIANLGKSHFAHYTYPMQALPEHMPPPEKILPILSTEPRVKRILDLLAALPEEERVLKVRRIQALLNEALDTWPLSLPNRSTELSLAGPSGLLGYAYILAVSDTEGTSLPILAKMYDLQRQADIDSAKRRGVDTTRGVYSVEPAVTSICCDILLQKLSVNQELRSALSQTQLDALKEYETLERKPSNRLDVMNNYEEVARLAEAVAEQQPTILIERKNR